MNILELFGLKKKPEQVEQTPAPAAPKAKAPAPRKPAAKMQPKPKAGKSAPASKPVKKAAGRGR